jgi:hypothetical protein
MLKTFRKKTTALHRHDTHRGEIRSELTLQKASNGDKASFQNISLDGERARATGRKASSRE